MILNIFTILILFILIVFSTIQFFNILFRGYAPLISTNKNFIKKILEQNPIAKNFTIDSVNTSPNISIIVTIINVILINILID